MMEVVHKTNKVELEDEQITVRSPPSTNQRPTFYRPDDLPVAQSTEREKVSHSTDLLTPISPGVLQPFL